MTIELFCKHTYAAEFQAALHSSGSASKKSSAVAAQKRAICATAVKAMRTYPALEAAVIWGCLATEHIKAKSGVEISYGQVEKVKSAAQSWVKSSGHAFEELVLELANPKLKRHQLRLLLKRELTVLLANKSLANRPNDTKWLAAHSATSDFDAFAAIENDGSTEIFGCLQLKTSIRERVKGEREPSEQAMKACLWSVAVVLNGDFLRLPKFQGMVNGGTASYPQNGWHGLYVFSDKYTNDRIFAVDKDMTVFVEHARQAAEFWKKERNWFKHDWRPA